MRISRKNMMILLLVAALVLVTVVLLVTQFNITVPRPSEDLAEGLVDATVQTAEGTVGFLEGFLNRLTQTPQSEIVRVLLVVGGVLLLVFGWRVYDFIVVIAGFLIGASVAMALVTSTSTMITLAAFLLGGLLGAVLSVFLYYIAVFLIGAYIGIVLTSALASALSLTPISPFVLLIGGLIGALVLLGMAFEFLLLLSALVGAQMLSLGLGLGFTWTLIFAIAGVIIQLVSMRMMRYDYRTYRRRRPVPLYRRVFS